MSVTRHTQLQSIEASSEDEEQEAPSTPPVDSPRSDSESAPPPPPAKSREMQILEEAMAAAESSLAAVQSDLHSAQVSAGVQRTSLYRPSCITLDSRSSAKRFSCSSTNTLERQVKLKRDCEKRYIRSLCCRECMHCTASAVFDSVCRLPGFKRSSYRLKLQLLTG